MKPPNLANRIRYRALPPRPTYRPRRLLFPPLAGIGVHTIDDNIFLTALGVLTVEEDTDPTATLSATGTLTAVSAVAGITGESIRHRGAYNPVEVEHRS